MITILIKTFLRPAALKRLLDSIKKYYPNIRIIVMDDEDDMGVSAGRNRLVEMCQTEYCLLLDDDCVFTDKTDLEGALKELKERDLDIIQFNTQKDNESNYQGVFETVGDTVHYKPSREPYEFCLNIFLAKTEVLRKYPWNEKYKMGEHFAYFYTNRGKLKIGKATNSIIEHWHEGSEEYNKYRGRAVDYVKEYMKDNNIKKRVDLGGTELYAV